MKIFFMASLYIVLSANAKVPDWAANNSTKLNGSILTTVCNGVGPSLDIARADAVKSCQHSASQYFNTKIKIKSLTVESEKSVGFHQEISSDDEIKNLICEPSKDQIEEFDSQFKIWIECKFDLNKVVVKNVIKDDSPPDNKTLSALESSRITKTADIQDKVVFISSVPKCESLIVKGNSARTIQCSKNPLKIKIKESDIEIIVRANGYKPKTIQLKGIKANETVQVLLDLL